MTSGIRPPSLSLRQISGSPRCPAQRAIRFCLRMFTWPVVPARTVASTASTHTLRPPMRAKPATIASAGAGFSRRCSGSASSPISKNEPASTSASRRSRAVSRPEAWCRATRSGPPIASAAARRCSSSARRSAILALSGPGPAASSLIDPRTAASAARRRRRSPPRNPRSPAASRPRRRRAERAPTPRR